LTQLDKVAELATAERAKAAGHLQEERQKHDAAQQQLQQLEQFLAEYEDDLRAASAAGIGATQLQDYRRFLVALNAAIEQQTRVLEQSGGAVSSQRQKLQVKNDHCSRLDQLLDSYRAAEQREAGKREQRQQDDRFSSVAQNPVSEH